MPRKFESLFDAIWKSNSTEAELRSAWSQLTPAEVRELQGDGDGAGKVEFDARVEHAPIHLAAASGKLPSVEFLLVSTRTTLE